MAFLKDRQKRKLFITITSIILVLGVLVVGCAIYLGDYYKADWNTIDAFSPMNEIEFKTLENKNIVFEVEDAKIGFVFYPGGKVESDAYLPLMAELASKGVTCVLADMPFNLAVLDINAADGIVTQYPKIKKWYIGGHSLGGSMAASYLSKHTDDFDGLVLLGSYSTANLSDKNIDVLSVYGSEDKIMNREKYSENKENLPSNFKEIVLDGGCHAYFGMYGEQDGDGTPSITNEEQICITADAIMDFMN